MLNTLHYCIALVCQPKIWMLLVACLAASFPAWSQDQFYELPTTSGKTYSLGDLPTTSANDLYEIQSHPHEIPSPIIQEEPQACAGCAAGKACHGVCKHPGTPAKPKRTLPGDRDLGDCPPKRYLMDDCERAGSPHCVARWAKCGVNEKYSAWFTGGGAAFFRGRPRHSDEGTWGLDYNGLFGHANVWLNYTRHRNQGGEGAYETIGGPEPFHFLKHE